MAFLFISRSAPLLPVLPFPYLRGSYRFRPPMASVYRAWRGGDMPSEGGGLILLLVPPSRFICPALRSVRFHRIGLKPGNVRRFCQLVFLCHQLTAGAYRFPLLATLVRSSRSSSRLARLVGRLVAALCGSPFVSSCLVNSLASRLSSRSAVRLSLFVLPVVSRCFALPGSSFARLVRSSRQAVRVLSFRPAARLGGSWCVSLVGVPCSPSRSFPFSYHLARCVSCGHGGGSSFFSSRGGVLSSPLPPVVESDWADVGGGMNAPFVSARFFHQARAMAMMIWIRPQGNEAVMRRWDNMGAIGNGNDEVMSRLDKPEGMIDTMTARMGTTA